jgi:hypothetical protein
LPPDLQRRAADGLRANGKAFGGAQAGLGEQEVELLARPEGVQDLLPFVAGEDAVLALVGVRVGRVLLAQRRERCSPGASS